MLKISREVDLGLLLMADLVKSKEPVGLKGWARKWGLPYRFLSKVAVKLKKAGLVKSKEGRDGGYSLKMKPNKIKVMRIIEVLDGPIAPVRCMSGEKCECADLCGHKNLMEKLTEVVEGQLSKVSLKDLC